MKVIDLLNKIANGEENDLETEFEFDKKIWNFYKLNHSEYCLDGWLLNQNITITKHKEVLEEEKKLPKKIKIEQDTPSSNYYIRNENGTKCGLTKHSKMIAETLNQLIDYLKSKGDE